jgi:hypothetical protein
MPVCFSIADRNGSHYAFRLVVDPVEMIPKFNSVRSASKGLKSASTVLVAKTEAATTAAFTIEFIIVYRSFIEGLSMVMAGEV